MIQPRKTQGETDWFVHDRFGLFIHWGLYALGARHEWLKRRERMTTEEYQKYFDHFDPDLFDPQKWAKNAKAAGMKYVVVTTKHHDGFCLWDTAYTHYNATNTACGKDLLHEIVEAFRAEGLRIGFYYSLLDWHHPHFTIDYHHPQREHPQAIEMNQGREIAKYAAYMRDQVRELLTNYGQVDLLWFDYSYPNIESEFPHQRGKGRDDWESEKLMALVRELAPHIMVNNRLNLPDTPADMYTPEQFQPTEWIEFRGEPVVWEACQTLSGSWGYHRDEATWKSASQLIQMLIDTVSKGGNLLMNVGPTGRGTLDNRALDALQAYEEWMKWHERAIVGCTQSEFQAPTDVRYTQNFDKNRLYVHLFAYPFRHLHLPHLGGRVTYAQFLNDASEIQWETGGKTGEHENMGIFMASDILTLELPVVQPNTEVVVIELFLKD